MKSVKFLESTDPTSGVRSVAAPFYSPTKETIAPRIVDLVAEKTALPTNTRTAELLWTPPPPAKLVIADEAALRSALAACLEALAKAREAELVIAGRVSTAAQEHGAAERRHAAAASATAAARVEAATALQAWMASEDPEGRPGTGAVSAAAAVEAAAKIDVEVWETALGDLKAKHENAIATTEKLKLEAEKLSDQVVLAQASHMAANLIDLNDKVLELHRVLTELVYTFPSHLVPAGIVEATKMPKPKAFEISSVSPGVRRWSTLRNDLRHDAQATVGPLGD